MGKVFAVLFFVLVTSTANAAVFEYVTDNFFKVLAGPQSWTAECPTGQTLNRVVLVGQSIMGDAIDNATKSGWAIQSANALNERATGFVLALTKNCK